MLSLIRISWRNLWRNARRTAITMSALTLGVAVIVGLDSYREATFAQMIRSVTQGLVGHLQVHGRGYQESPELGTVVQNPAQVEAEISRALPGATPERRVIGAGLAGTGDASTAVLVLGIQPGRSQEIRRIVNGQELSEQSPKRVVIGRGLADELGLKVGDELVLVGQAVDGSVANDKFTIAGMAATDSSEMDAHGVFLKLADAQEFFGLGDAVHQVVVRLPGEEQEDLTRPLSVLKGALDLASLEAMTWSQILPELKGMVEGKRQGQQAVNFIVFLIVALGVLNTTSMAVFERTRELGVMASLGTRPRRLWAMVVTEAVLQGLLSFALGVGAAWLVLHAVGTVDLTKLSNADMMGVRMPDAVQLHLQTKSVAGAFTVALFTVVAGSLFPAIRASRLKPVEAARFV
ncbi:MAG TPA: FtsX-like permease family protein [Myxococcaceae bacterium]|jgi:ABC-type lipoprotein release transport system permease subunit